MILRLKKINPGSFTQVRTDEIKPVTTSRREG